MQNLTSRRALAGFSLCAIVCALSACGGSPTRTTTGSSAAPRPSAASEALPYFIGVDSLALYPAPRAADQKASLPLHQKVLRTRLENGWAFVTVEESGAQGWVDNAKLIWKLPSTTAPAAPPAAPPATPPAADKPAGQSPSVLDAY